MTLDTSNLAATSVYMPGFQPFTYFAPSNQILSPFSFTPTLNVFTYSWPSPRHVGQPWVCTFCDYKYFALDHCSSCDHDNLKLYHALTNDREHYRAQFAKHRFFIIKDIPHSVWKIIAQYISYKDDDLPPLVDVDEKQRTITVSGTTVCYN